MCIQQKTAGGFLLSVLDFAQITKIALAVDTTQLYTSHLSSKRRALHQFLTDRHVNRHFFVC